jgi:hypothetical protein
MAIRESRAISSVLFIGIPLMFMVFIVVDTSTSSCTVFPLFVTAKW